MRLGKLIKHLDQSETRKEVYLKSGYIPLTAHYTLHQQSATSNYSDPKFDIEFYKKLKNQFILYNYFQRDKQNVIVKH